MSTEGKIEFCIDQESFNDFVNWLGRKDEKLDIEIAAEAASTPNKLAPTVEQVQHLGRTAFLAGQKEQILEVTEKLAQLSSSE